ncbi:glycosyltransferase [Pedobacter deserti]|uniref:glycosyltransferase n=1 Tax=Pedobacter deserti TaxID=2817382 RepID=UPI00210EF69D|nr:glycosyltransferase [Pedobacter sp. SYSU D00382]
MKNELISIALCTYNGEKHIEAQLDTLLAQDYPNFEVVIVDDCSADSTYDILESYRDRNKRIRLYRNENNIGFNRNFEKALGLCEGTYIAIADQDDVWDLQKLSKLYAAIGSSLLIYHDSAVIEEDRLTGKRLSDGHRFVSGHCEQYLLYNNCVSGHASLFHCSLKAYVLPFPKETYYDWWMAYTAASLGRIKFITEPLVSHRRHASNTTSSDTRTTERTRRINTLKLFKNHAVTPRATGKLIDQLLDGYAVLERQPFSRTLLVTLLRHRSKLFFVRKRSAFTLFKFILNECLANSGRFNRKR